MLAIFVFGFCVEKHLFCYFLLLEGMVIASLVVLGVLSTLSFQLGWFLIFMSVAVIESVLGLSLYISTLRLHGRRDRKRHV